MRRRVLRGVRVSLLSATAFLGATVTPAIAQGCSEQLARDFLVGWSHDMPKLLPLFTDDVVYEDTTVHSVARGKEELRNLADGFFKVYPDLTFSLKSAIISGDRAAVVWWVTGTQRGDMPGMPASNKTFSEEGVSIMECADGKIRHNVDYWDMATVMRQLGHLPDAAKATEVTSKQ